MTIRLECKSGLLLVLSAPSGGGKSTITRELLASDQTLRYSISATSRPARANERDGEHYFFLNEQEFEDRAARGEFYEFARVHGHLYGTRKEWIEEQMNKCRDVVLDIDVQGGQEIKRRVPDAILLFILPPSMVELERRLRSRATDKEEVIQRRLDNARREMIYASRYDFVVVNDRLPETIRQIQRIIEVERLRSKRQRIITDGESIELA